MRELGFYWVRRECWSGEPEVAHWDGNEWFQCGDDRGAYDDSEPPVEVLSERLTPPGADDELTGILREFVMRTRKLLDGRIDLDAKGVGFRVQVKQLKAFPFTRPGAATGRSRAPKAPR